MTPTQNLRALKSRAVKTTGIHHRSLTAALTMGGVWLALGASPVWAAEGGSANPWMDLLWKAINLLALLVLLHLFARKPLLNMFRAVAEGTKQGLSSQREDAEQAKREQVAQKEKIAGLQAELERLVAEARKEATDERDRLIEEARGQAGRIAENTRQQVAQEFSKARIELRRQLAEETVKLAEKMITERLDDSARERLVGTTIEQLGASS